VCGICGIVGEANEAHVRWMTAALAHRGPDGEGVRVFHEGLPAALGHRRLSIIDPSPAGAQPMGWGDRWWITYNGELYNFRELRRDLERDGHRFVSNSDTEVLLRLYAEFGPEMLPRLNGIFAFAVWDAKDQRLFMARDRVGTKPLYYTRQGDRFGFASEIKALLPLLGRPQLDLDALAQYLTFLWVPDPRTAFVGVEQLPAGHYALFDGDRLRIEQYWDLSFAPEHRSVDDWSDLVASTVETSVRRQMVSDVPLGSFLSGGVDSSAVVADMSRDGAERVSTFTVGFGGDDLRHEIVPDDVRYARKVGALFQTDYREQILEADVLDLLPRAVWHLDEPLADPAAISTYLICREARRTMPVMLSGMGADEIFAGYPRHLALEISRRLDRLPGNAAARLERVARPFVHPGRAGRLRGPRRNLWKYLRAAGASPLDRYLSFASYYDRSELIETISPAVADAIGLFDPLAVHRKYLDGSDGRGLNQLLYLDVKTFLPNLNLTYTDKMGMAASVEVRVPLLDNELIDLSARIPPELKLRGLRRKYIFKRSQERHLPRDVVWRRKAGFGAPVRAWLVGDLGAMMDELLSPAALDRRGLIDAATVTRLRRDNDEGREDNSLRLYAILCLELWCRTFVDRSWSFDDVATLQSVAP
jgi:asparagine synthase (glutamine-hydrolysing)